MKNVVETPEAETPAADPIDPIAAAVAVLEAAGYRVKAASAKVARATDVKADPAVVKAYFASTGLTRKQIAAAVGVCTSVIATVQNPKGDRWSAQRFELARPLIDAEVARIAALAAAVPAVDVAAPTA